MHFLSLLLVCFSLFTPERTLWLMNVNRRAKSSKHACGEQPADERYAAEGWSGPQPRTTRTQPAGGWFHRVVPARLEPKAI